MSQVVSHPPDQIRSLVVLTLRNLSGCEEGPGVCALLLTVVSLLLIVLALPLSLVCVVKVVQVVLI